jgi:hypothetical protein
MCKINRVRLIEDISNFLTVFFAQDQHFSKIHKTEKKFFLAKTKKYISYDIQ